MAINRREVDDMRKHSAWIIELLLDLLFPARGRHRSADAPPAPERRERRSQRARRRALWLAVHGIDAGPRRIHGVEVGC
ncbi:hypothetical protein [Streptomyces sp. SID8354]|uniref:hypothetical protein n=1 Tax=Streptomyces sp. SID8354 TaxID=2690339 RepID=UPI0009984E0E|nr:hypothetical protein [Streptomyces sp. SID8354]